MNKVIISGYVSKKGVDLKCTPGEGKSVATYTINVPDKFKKGEYEFINCVTWGSQGEWLATNQDNIKKVLVEGRIKTRSYEKDGSKRYVTEVITDSVEVMEWATSAPNFSTLSANDSADSNMFDDMTPVDDGDIPF